MIKASTLPSPPLFFFLLISSFLHLLFLLFFLFFHFVLFLLLLFLHLAGHTAKQQFKHLILSPQS